MALAFGVSTEERSDSLGKLQGAFKLGLSDLESMGDVMGYLSSTSQASSNDLMKSMAAISGVTTQFGLSVQATAGLATTFVKIGYEASQSSAAVNQLLIKLGTAADGTSKAAAEACKAIGIVPETLKTMMKDNPEQALIYALEKIKAVPMHKQREALLQIFGAKAQAHASKLADNVDVLKDTFASLADKTKVAGSLQKDYEATMGTTKEQMKLFKNSFEQLGIAIGEAVLPAFTSMMQSVTGFFQKITDFSKEHVQVFSFLTKATGLVLGLAAGAAVLKMAFYGVRAGMAGIGVVFKGLALVAQLNPVILAITGLAVGATLVIKYWTQVKNFFVNLWTGLTEKFAAVSAFFSNIGSSISGVFKKLWPFGNKETAVETTSQTDPKTSLSHVQLSTPANKVAANSNKTQNNNFTFHINSHQDAKDIADEISKAVQQSTRDALYDPAMG
ncbi:hypothetical protein AGMMS49949_07010 [Alphaproteobacteria bacterium]|nr:hypothetical protein AGMMS49949_07010 [Alphaproteobacteria bacterium]